MATVLAGEIDVAAPPRRVYECWIDVATFPDFLEMVQEVRVVDEVRSFWRVRIGRSVQDFYADIVDAEPARRVGWQSTDGVLHSGHVEIEEQGDSTHISLRMIWDQQDPFAGIGLPVAIDQDIAQRDLQRFKRMVEARARSDISR
ncbi:SRPBCC family protein [Microbacterium oryzae]|uniref:SRPBCC family protein n=1 Tax=Microbacterium oryzae TaxID=743009 RepID=UPI0025B2169F|nr:SRPBCC family protein [Microbacterium oryzae]MDN3311374.1 SRPBCC family protein [Microbacterium oryzae]